MFERYSDILTVKELCEMLKIGRNTAYELVRANIIQNVQIGRQIRISKKSVIDYIDRMSKNTQR